MCERSGATEPLPFLAGAPFHGPHRVVSAAGVRGSPVACRALGLLSWVRVAETGCLGVLPSSKWAALIPTPHPDAFSRSPSVKFEPPSK